MKLKSNVRLEEIAQFINGYAFKPCDWHNEGKKIIRIQNLTDKSKPYNLTTLEIPKQYKVIKGDILVSWSATLDVFEWEDDDEAWLNQHIFKVISNESKITKSYFKYALKNTIESMLKYTHGSTMKHIVRNDFLNTKIYLPTIDQQKRIVAILDKADALRQKRKQALALLDELLRSTFLEMFGDPIKNPKAWKIEKLADVGKLERGISKNRPRNAPELLGGPYPLIQTGDIANSGGYIRYFNQTYSELGLKQSKIWPAGTLCITIAANIAKTGILTFDACFPDSVVGFIPNKKTNDEYIQFWLSFLQKSLEDTAPESAQKNINLQILRNLTIPIPPIDIQTQFAKIVEQTEVTKARMQQSLQELENQFQALMQRAFKGEL